MHIVCLPEKTRSEDLGLNLPDPSISMGSVTSVSFSVSGSPLRQERKTPLQASLDLVLGFGEGVVDVMCHDGTGGHDVCKVLQLGLASGSSQHSAILQCRCLCLFSHVIDAGSFLPGQTH